MPSEKIVCSSPNLSKLDDQMFAAYSKAKSESANPESLKNEQIGWIKEVRACGNDENCISNLYTKRISQLTPTSSSVAEKPTQTTQVAKDQIAEVVALTQPQTIPIEATDPASAQKEIEQKNEPPISNTATTNSNIEQKTEDQYGLLGDLIVYGLGLILFALSFALYVKNPKNRTFTFAPPFDVGVISDGEDLTKNKRRWIEFGLLLLSLLIYVVCAAILSSDTRGGAIFLYATLIAYCLLSFGITTGLYIIFRKIAGFATRCPECKNPFAKKRISFHRDPRSTFEKPQTGNADYILLMETGVEHSDYTCVVCSHSWHEANQYTRQISGRKR
jgi:uncharacterized protein